MLLFGSCLQVPLLESITPGTKTCTFKDGQTADMDAIIFCTGCAQLMHDHRRTARTAWTARPSPHLRLILPNPNMHPIFATRVARGAASWSVAKPLTSVPHSYCCTANTKTLSPSSDQVQAPLPLPGPVAAPQDGQSAVVRLPARGDRLSRLPEAYVHRHAGSVVHFQHVRCPGLPGRHPHLKPSQPLPASKLPLTPPPTHAAHTRLEIPDPHRQSAKCGFSFYALASSASKK